MVFVFNISKLTSFFHISTDFESITDVVCNDMEETSQFRNIKYNYRHPTASFRLGHVAQLVEGRTSKPKVAGSNPNRSQVKLFSTCSVWVCSLGVALIYLSFTQAHGSTLLLLPGSSSGLIPWKNFSLLSNPSPA